MMLTLILQNKQVTLGGLVLADKQGSYDDSV